MLLKKKESEQTLLPFPHTCTLYLLKITTKKILLLKDIFPKNTLNNKFDVFTGALDWRLRLRLRFGGILMQH